MVPAVFHETVGLVPNVWLPESASVVSTLPTVIVEVAIVSEKVRVRVSVAENCVEPSTSLHETESSVGAVSSCVTFVPVRSAWLAVVVASPAVPPTEMKKESSPSVHVTAEVVE